MDARLFLLLSANRAALNNLPFTVTQVGTDVSVSAYFVQATLDDSSEINSWPDCGVNGWPPGCSMFHDVWLLVLGQSDTLKLVAADDPHNRIQGLLRLDYNSPCVDRSNRLLETAPANQKSVEERRYGGVGRTLVVRMALECFLQNNGTLFIRTHPSNAGFYTSLYFIQNPRFRDRFALDHQDMERLLTEYFFGR